MKVQNRKELFEKISKLEGIRDRLNVELVRHPDSEVLQAYAGELGMKIVRLQKKIRKPINNRNI